MLPIRRGNLYTTRISFSLAAKVSSMREIKASVSFWTRSWPSLMPHSRFLKRCLNHYFWRKEHK